MCLILLVWRVHPRYPCVIAANRDEFHHRAAAPAAWWPDRGNLLAGRDRSAGGTWLGVARDGRFAALTNYRGSLPLAPAAPSRGGLVVETLERGESVAETLARLALEGPRYNGFNLVFSDGERLGIHESERGAGRELGPGIYGLSNHLLDSPWPKVLKAKSRLRAALDDLEDPSPLLDLLRDDEPAPDGELPRSGLGLEWDRLLSSAFVRSAEYGTRCSTTVLMDDRGGVRFDEWTWDSSGLETGRVSQRFTRTLLSSRS